MDFSDHTKQRKLNDVGITYCGRLGAVYLERECRAIYLLGYYLGCHPAPDSLSSLTPSYHLYNIAPPRMHQACFRPSAFAYFPLPGLLSLSA